MLPDLPALSPVVSSLSFPSAHATTSFAAARAYRGLAPAGLLYGAAGAFALSRPYLGVHYPRDVLAGAVLGTVLAGRVAAMKVGIVGMPNAGKSSLFTALTGVAAEAANYPFTTIEPNVAIVPVTDDRLNAVADTVRASKLVPDTIAFHDIAGLVAGATSGEGLGNQFLANIRETDAIVHVVRAHTDESIIHPEGRVDPMADIDTIETELVYADLEQAERRLDRVAKQAKTGDRHAIAEAQWLRELVQTLQAGRPARTLPATGRCARRDGAAVAADRQAGPVRGQRRGGSDRGSGGDRRPRGRPGRERGRRLGAAGGRAGRAAPTRTRQRCARISVWPNRAWPRSSAAPSRCWIWSPSSPPARTSPPSRWHLRQGLTVWHAAGQIHSDIQRGFVRAEVVSWDQLTDAGGYAGARDRGTLRLEGRDYVVADGDVITVKFTP